MSREGLYLGVGGQTEGSRRAISYTRAFRPNPDFRPPSAVLVDDRVALCSRILFQWVGTPIKIAQDKSIRDLRAVKSAYSAYAKSYIVPATDESTLLNRGTHCIQASLSGCGLEFHPEACWNLKKRGGGGGGHSSKLRRMKTTLNHREKVVSHRPRE